MTTKSDAHELLILLQLLSFDIKNTTRNRNKKTLEKGGLMRKNVTMRVN